MILLCKTLGALFCLLYLGSYLETVNVSTPVFVATFAMISIVALRDICRFTRRIWRKGMRILSRIAGEEPNSKLTRQECEIIPLPLHPTRNYRRPIR